MALPEKLLGRDEHVVKHLRAHVIYLAWHLGLLITVVVICSLLVAFLPEHIVPWGLTEVGIVAVIVVILAACIRWLRWFAATYTLTNRRIITQSGLFTKTGNDIALGRISRVEFQQSFFEKLVGAGTLIYESDADPHGDTDTTVKVVLACVPAAHGLQQEINQLIAERQAL